MAMSLVNVDSVPWPGVKEAADHIAIDLCGSAECPESASDMAGMSLTVDGC